MAHITEQVHNYTNGHEKHQKAHDSERISVENNYFPRHKQHKNKLETTLQSTHTYCLAQDREWQLKQP